MEPIKPVFLVTLLIVGLVSTGCRTDESESATAPSATSGTSDTENPPTGRQRTYSGLQYEMLRPGTGKRPLPYSQVTVHYHGYLPDGTVFDSSVQKGEPATFPLNRVIAGWQEGIPLMQEGAKYRFTIPPHLAYGESGSPPKIGPNATLIFDVELIKVHL
ncbi:MAG: FKBP-type peptidyl-prolyl cis-trans isomerase [Verrucomicrobiota bacterium]